MVRLESASPLEDRMEEDFERKRESMRSWWANGEADAKGPDATLLGCRGFAGPSLIRALKTLVVK